MGKTIEPTLDSSLGSLPCFSHISALSLAPHLRVTFASSVTLYYSNSCMDAGSSVNDLFGQVFKQSFHKWLQMAEWAAVTRNKV